MERYCIGDYEEELGYENEIMKEFERGIKVNEFEIVYAGLSRKRLYDEVGVMDEISEIISRSCKSSRMHADYAEEMYQSIFNINLFSKIVKLDLCMHIYYTVLYEKNRNTYIPLVENDWAEEKKKEIRNKRRDYKSSIKKGEGKEKLPFHIEEKENSASEGGRPNEVTKILDFAPDVSRLGYLSPEFRKVFRSIKKNIDSKYSYSNIKRIFEENDMEFKRKEEIWLMERLLGVNLVWAFYSFFVVIFKDINFNEVEKEFKMPKSIEHTKYYVQISKIGEKTVEPHEIEMSKEKREPEEKRESEEITSSLLEYVKGIIHEIMKWEGIYSRIELIREMKVIVELRFRSEKCEERIKPEAILQYLYENVIQQRMDVLANAYKEREARIYCEFRKEAKTEEILESLEGECDKLMDEYFNDGGKYRLLKDIDKLVNGDKEENSADEESERINEETKGRTQGEIRKKALKENLYQLIQKIVIEEQII